MIKLGFHINLTRLTAAAYEPIDYYGLSGGLAIIGEPDEPLEGQILMARDYCGSHIYRNGVLERVENSYGYWADSCYHYRITDYQGNVRAVISQNGTLEEVNGYYPYGGITGAPASGVQANKYGGKELDRENGLDWYDFEARMYDPMLPQFKSMDMLLEKKPWISPYAYCLCNPIHYVDPTGLDEWEIDNMGNIVNHYKTTKHDAFYVIDNKGRRSSDKSIIFKHGTIDHYLTQTTDNGILYDVYKLHGDKSSSNLFEFVSQHTKVEWSQASLGIKGKNGLNFITTAHKRNTEPGMSDLFDKQLKNGYTLRSFKHNHPKNTTVPSGLDDFTGDIGFAMDVILYSGQVPDFKIYLPKSNKYISYSAWPVKKEGSKKTHYEQSVVLKNLVIYGK